MSRISEIFEGLFFTSVKKTVISLVLFALLVSLPVTVILVGQQQTYRQNAASIPVPEPTNKTACLIDSDCGCGTDITTKACVVENKKYIDATKQCPDFCSGIGGNLTVKCTSNVCIQVTTTGEVPLCEKSTIPPASGSAPLKVTLYGSGKAGGPSSGVVGYQWDFDGNGTWDSGISIDPVSNTYLKPGTYNPKFRIQGANKSWSAICSYAFPVVVAKPTGNPTPTCTPRPPCLDSAQPCIMNIPPGGWCPKSGLTTLQISVKLPAIGSDTKKGENDKPKNPTKNVILYFYSSADTTMTKEMANVPGKITFDGTYFKGNIDLGKSILTGNYNVKVKIPNTLRKLIVGTQHITAGTVNTFPVITLASGDLDNNNVIDIADYNALVACFGSKQCANKDQADLNDDGVVDEIDLNILKSALSARQGD
ncbi:hypothetical protein M1349_03755 [Patescibacteria group bacterium]|nr:hypothetical protein [Patescibacteria group bacterium]